MGWALGMGLVGALARLGDPLDRPVRAPIVHRNRVLVTAGLGLLIGLLAMGYQLVTGQQLRSGVVLREDALPDWSRTPPTIRSAS
jgi:hypothetical protein